MAVACDVYGSIYVLSVFPKDVLDEILNLIKSVSEGLLTYSCRTVVTFVTDFSICTAHSGKMIKIFFIRYLFCCKSYLRCYFF